MWPNVEFQTQLPKKNSGLIRLSLQQTTRGWTSEKGPRTVGFLSLPSSHTKFSSLFVIMELTIFTYSFTINGYDVTVTIEFFSHIVVLEDSSPELTNDESENVDIFLSL